MILLHLKITGGLLILLAVFHVFFPKRFDWEKECSGMNLLNRQMMYVHTFFIALIVLLMGILCICCAEELVTTSLGRKISWGIFAFWVIRLIFQLFVYSPELWKGKKFETSMHILFSLLWMYMSVVFLIAAAYSSEVKCAFK